MTFDRAKSTGWTPGNKLTSTQTNTMDVNLTNALDGGAGGNYSPSSALVVTGSGLDGYFSNMKVQGDEWTYIDSSGNAEHKSRSTKISPMLLAGYSSAVSENFDFRTKLQTDDGDYALQLPNFPVGAVLESVDMMVLPGAARASASDRVRVSIYRVQSLNFDTVTTGTATLINGVVAEDDGTAVLQVVTATVDKTTNGETYHLTVRSGVDASSNNDSIYGFRINWTDPGPRNY